MAPQYVHGVAAAYQGGKPLTQTITETTDLSGASVADLAVTLAQALETLAKGDPHSMEYKIVMRAVGPLWREVSWRGLTLT